MKLEESTKLTSPNGHYLFLKVKKKRVKNFSTLYRINGYDPMGKIIRTISLYSLEMLPLYTGTFGVFDTLKVEIDISKGDNDSVTIKRQVYQNKTENWKQTGIFTLSKQELEAVRLYLNSHVFTK